MARTPDGQRYTPTQQRIMDLLADGLRHNKYELHACLEDQLGPVSNIHAHLSILRTYLRGRGLDILCEYYNRGIHYRLVRLLHATSKE